MRVVGIRHSWWLVAMPCLLFVLPESTSFAIALPLAIAALLVSGRALRRLAHVPVGFNLLFSGALALVLSMVVRGVHASVSGVDFPYPSPADVLAAVGYVLVIFGTYRIAHARRAFSGQGDAYDTLILALAIAGPFWIGILGSYFADGSFSVGHRVLSGVYALVEVTIAALLLRLAAGPGSRPKAYWFLACSAVSIALLDALAILDTIGRGGGRLFVPFAAIGYVGFAHACRADDLDRLFDRPPASEPRLTASRLATLTIGIGTIPVLLVIEGASGGGRSWVTIAFSTALGALVLGRITGLFRSRDKIADYDAALRAAGRELLAAASVDEVADIVEQTTAAIWPGAEFRAVLRTGTEAPVLLAGRAGAAFNHTSGPWPPSEDEALTRIPDLTADPGLAVTVKLGHQGSRGILTCSSDAPLLHAQQLALQTFGAQAAMALHSIESREHAFQKRADERLQALVAQSADIIAVLDDGAVIFVSPNATTILGYDHSEMIGRDPVDIVHPDDADATRALIEWPSSVEASPYSIEARIRGAGDEYRWFLLTARDYCANPEVGGIVLTARDVTEERAAKIGLERSEQWFRGLVQHSSDVIAVLDEDGVFTYASPAIEALTGLSPTQLQGQSFLDLLPRDELASVERIRHAIRSKPPGVRSLEIQIARIDGTRRTAEATITDLRDDPSVRGLVLNVRDVTDRKRLEEDLRHQVLHDDLTGLGSRVQFTSQLERALGPSRRAGSMVAALFIDIDDFKTINDSLGHAAGDQVLVEVSSRLRSRLRLHDNAARFGGDEFAVLLTDVYGESDVTLVADRVVEELSQPVELHGQEVRLSVSVGIAIDDDGTKTSEDLVRSADVAMYEAKDKGKSRWAMFEDSMADQTLERFELGNSLGHAIENDELVVYYQPIVDLSTGHTIGVEALVRWNHPVRGMVSPGQFIPIAERTNLIVPLGAWVLDQAVRQVAAWRAAGHDIYASVNISAVQLQRSGIVAEVLEIVDRAGIDRAAVVLELTESALINDFERVNARIDALRRGGLRVAIDDFGTGYASLTYADQFTADILKIDQSFVAKLEDSDESAIVSTVLSIARSIGAQTVAEGIEVPDQHRRLLALGCSIGQGYYFTRPAPAAVISESLSRELEGEALLGHGH